MQITDYEYADVFASGDWDRCLRAFWHAAKTIYERSDGTRYAVQLWASPNRGAVVILHRGTGGPLSVPDMEAILGMTNLASSFSPTRVTGQRMASLWGDLMDTFAGCMRTYEGGTGLPRLSGGSDMPPPDLHPNTWG